MINFKQIVKTIVAMAIFIHYLDTPNLEPFENFLKYAAGSYWIYRILVLIFKD